MFIRGPRPMANLCLAVRLGSPRPSRCPQSAAASCPENAPWRLDRKACMSVWRNRLEVYALVCGRGATVLVLERINTPEPPRYLILVFLAFFLLLGFLIMSAEVFSLAVDLDGRFLAILAHDCVV